MHNNLLHIEIFFLGPLFFFFFAVENLDLTSKCGFKFSSFSDQSENTYTVSVKCRYRRHMHEH